MATTILPLLQMILAFGNICVLGYALIKFLAKPHNTLEDRVDALEHDMNEVKARLLKGNDRFREQDETIQVLIHSVLALIEFEIQYCLIENKPMSKDLEKAKESLHTYLAKR